MKLLDDSGLSYFYSKIKAIFAKKSEIPTKTSQLSNDNNFNYSREATAGTIDALATLTSGKPRNDRLNFISEKIKWSRV